MKQGFFLVCAMCMACAAHADRISQMNQTERCAYTAQLQVAAYYFYEQDKPREEVSIKWHGDETSNEIEFVNKTVAEAYLWLSAWKGSSNAPLSAQSFGDMVYQACMNKKDL